MDPSQSDTPKSDFDPKPAFEEIANGNEPARQCCWAIYGFLHLIDDLYDRDHVVSPEEMATVVVAFQETVAANPFFQTHREALLALLRVAWTSWVSSEGPPVQDAPEGTGDVLKSAYQEIFFFIASVTGGLPYGLAMSRKYRGYKIG